MKKFITLALAAALAVGLFAACAPKQEAVASPAPASEAPASEAPASEAPASEAPASEAPVSEAPASEAPAANVPNPIKDYGSLDDLIAATGIPMTIPHKATDIVVQSIDDKLNQVTFKVADGTEYTVRKAKVDYPDGDKTATIDGYYIEWKDEHEAATPMGVKVTVRTGNPDGSATGVVIWTDGEYKYAAFPTGDFNEEAMLTLVDGVK